MIILILAMLLGKVSEAHKKPGDQGMCGRARRAGRVINAYCVSPETRQREGRGGSLKSTKGGKDKKQARGDESSCSQGVSRNVNVVDIQRRVTLRQIGDTNAGRGSSIRTKSDWKTLRT